MTRPIVGWLLDLYPAPQGGLAVWLLEEDGVGENGLSQRRLQLRQAFPVVFYAAGPQTKLEALNVYAQSSPIPSTRRWVQRRDLFQPQPLTALSIQVAEPIDQPRLFAQLADRFPDLAYYDADLLPALRHAAACSTFPLAKLKLTIDDQLVIHSITPLNSPWDLNPELPPLRILRLEPNCDPRHAEPHYLEATYAGQTCRLALQPAEPLLINLAAILRRYDPDLLLTAWGDTWLLPRLIELSHDLDLPLPLNRDPAQLPAHRPEHTYFSYGQIIYRGQQVYLFGRWHIDIYNAMMYHDYGLDGILESARVTSLPVQAAARLSPGTGISAMQMVTALRRGVLVPWHKQHPEDAKTTFDLLHADQGGLVYQPLTGIYQHVAELDFVSMYPGIMARYNISPETLFSQPEPETIQVPEQSLWIKPEPPGLIPLTLQPLLDKRIALKHKAAELPKWDPDYRLFKARVAAHKWLLVTCFGYLGYKNARFGRIEAHQAVTAYSRECLLCAKEVAEEAGYTVLHMYVDGLWVYKPGCATEADYAPLLDEIALRTRLPIGLDGVYRWLVFLPSKVNPKVPVPNRYFGAFQDGSLKVRGIEARRGDTPAFIADVQTGLLEILSQAPDADHLKDYLPQVKTFLRQQVRRLRAGQVPLEQLLVTLKLSREINEYRVPSPAARAAQQLEQIGQHTRPGQHIKFLYTLGEPGVRAWNLTEHLPEMNPHSVDLPRYLILLLRAADSVLTPLGITANSILQGLYQPKLAASPPFLEK